jgi:glycosyltransferase involved in cell wall biosynthesis
MSTRYVDPSVLLVADGASIHTCRLATALAERGMRVHLAAFEGDPLPGVESHRLGSWPVATDQRYLLAIPRLARLIRRIRPDVINAHYLSSYGLLATVARRVADPARHSTILVQAVWGTDLLVTAKASRIRRALATLALRDADLVTADSSDLLAEAAALAPSTQRRRFIFGPPGGLIDRPRAEERVVVSTRRLDPDCRVRLVIAGFRAAAGMDPLAMNGWRLVIAGTGSEEASLRAQVGEDASIEFTGWIQPAAVHELLLRARANVSIPVSDATSAALLEAIAAGADPVVNDLAANREWVDPSIGHFVPRDPTTDEVGRAILAAVRFGGRATATREVMRAATWEVQVDGLVEAFKALLRGEGPGLIGRPRPPDLAASGAVAPRRS